jgi:exodeoxyribonuclease V beta subunit
MPGGALVGTIVHGALERVDFAAPDLVAEVARAVEHELAWRNVDLGNRDAAVAGLCAAIASPLGPQVDDVRLRDIARRDRLDELGFEIPLVGGDVPTAELHVADVADVLELHLPPGDPVRAYAERLRDRGLDGVLRGYLNGSLDLVFRLSGDRFVLADYKTNRLALPDETLTAWHYRPEAVESEMAEAHYPLQALIYSVALHRYLRWRLPRYDAAQNLSGVLYLFLRGMSAAEPTRIGEQPLGVWFWRPPPALVESLSDLFDGALP